MRRSIFRTRPANTFSPAFRYQTRRAFATPPIKDTTPPSPIERSKEQAHPIGPYYESILIEPQPTPTKKPEAPPSSSTNSLRSESPEPAPSAKRGRKPKEPKDDKTKSAQSAASVPSPVSPSAADTTTSTAVVTPSSTSASTSAPPPSSQHPKPSDGGSNPNSVQDRARVIFGSRLAGPAERAERLAAMRAHSRLVSGVLVPPRPEEPDNCCMSGCVNCVWDRYRDEMEAWASASAEAERRQSAAEAGVQSVAQGVTAQPGPGLGRHKVDEQGAVSMDDDGGGSARTWDMGGVPTGKITKDFWDEDMYKNVPVGIREFMKHEKRLREKHSHEGTLGG